MSLIDRYGSSTMLGTDPERLAGQVGERLRWLGNSPEDVADRLWLAAARGRDHSDAANPVLRFLANHLGSPAELRLPPGSPEVHLRRDGRSVRVALPPAVEAFLDRFYRGEFPELEPR
jgi:hypothetical protein